MTIVSCASTVIFFIFFYRYAVKNLELNRKARHRQKILISALSFSAMARGIVNVLLELDSLNLRDVVNCYDNNWYYALFLFMFQLIANILPVLVFLRVFSLERQQSTSEVLNTLAEDSAHSILIE